MNIKIIKDLSYIYGTDGIKSGDIFESQKCPQEYIDVYKTSMWILNENTNKYIRLLEYEYEKINE